MKIEGIVKTYAKKKKKPRGMKTIELS